MGIMIRMTEARERTRTAIERAISGAFEIRVNLQLNQRMQEEARVTRIAAITATNGMANLGSLERKEAVRKMLYGEGSEVEEWKDGKVGIVDQNGSTSVGINGDSRTRLVVNLKERKITIIVGPVKIEDGTPKAYETKVGVKRDADEEESIDTAVKMIRGQIMASYNQPEVVARLQEAMGILIMRELRQSAVN